MINSDEARKYLAKVGQRGIKTLETISSLRPFVESLETPLGKELLQENIETHQVLMNKIYDSLLKDGEVNQRDVIELQIRHRDLQRIYDKIKTYMLSIKLVKKTSEK
jgi:dsDNA-specific endonuclease/ATPase MutS2